MRRAFVTRPPTLAVVCCLFVLLSRAQNADVAGLQGGPPIQISASEAHEHFLSGSHLIHSAEPGWNGVDYVNLKIVVSERGNVLSATPTGGAQRLYEQAVALANVWQYSPFKRHGAPIFAAFDSYVAIVPPEKRPVEHIPFPQIKNWESLRMTLTRSECYGSCAYYELIIFGDGRVVYKGYDNVDYCGEYHGSVPHDVVQQLADSFMKADYFNLFDRYVLNATDSPTYTTSISFDGKTKSVIDYVGLSIGMPEVVSEIEGTMDRLAGPSVWVKPSEPHERCWHNIRTLDIPSRVE